MIHAVIAAFALAWSPPGPLDGFRANFSAIHAELDFTQAEGMIQGPSDRLWDEKDPGFAPTPSSERIGHWACDGETEYYRVSSPPRVFEAMKHAKVRREAGKAILPMRFFPLTEAIWNGTYLVGHSQDPSMVDHQQDGSWRTLLARPVPDKVHYLNQTRGPFHWGFLYPFPHGLKQVVPDAVPTPYRSERGGHPVEVDSYIQEGTHGRWKRLDIAYDPSVGYLPRHVQVVHWSPKRVLVDEMFLVAAETCDTGGFVPTEWYTLGVTSIALSAEEIRSLKGEAITLKGKLHGSHFLATSFTSRSAPVALQDVEAVHSIDSVGGLVPLEKPVSSLDLNEVESILGDRLFIPVVRALPTPDFAEIHEFDGKSRPGRWMFALAFAGAMVVVLAIFWRRQSARMVVVFCACGLSGVMGCGRVVDPVVLLSAGFKDPHAMHDPDAASMPMTLMIRNNGNQSLRLTKVDGGCTCRQVDQTALPLRLDPGGTISLPVTLSPTRATSAQDATFDFSTDRGTVSVSAPYITIVRHQFSPESLSRTSLQDRQPWSFLLTHRAIRHQREVAEPTKPRFPEDFEVRVLNTKRGRVGGLPDYLYEETNYQLTLTPASHDFEMHKAFVSLPRPGRNPILEVPIVWRRVPYLSAIPDRVSLGDRPIRVFLRCPDEDVELTSVLSAPDGIKAELRSPKEASVSLEPEAPDVIDGHVEIATTDAEHGTLKIPVVRYAPPPGH